LVAELRSQGGASAPAEAAKKNVEPRPSVTSITAPSKSPVAEHVSVGRIPPLTGTSNGAVAPVAMPEKSSSSMPGEDSQAKEDTVPEKALNGSITEGDSVLAQFRSAIASGTAPAAPPESPRLSLRQQQAEEKAAVQQRPFVQRAMELFEVPQGQLRYSPPDIDSDR
jgi:hypothetical protein